jgi:hypothetical protein
MKKGIIGIAIEIAIEIGYAIVGLVFDTDIDCEKSAGRIHDAYDYVL